MNARPLTFAFLMVLFLAPPRVGCAETGYDAWLRYAPIRDKAVLAQDDKLPATIVTLGNTPTHSAASEELVGGMRGMLGRILREASTLPAEPAIVLATTEELSTLDSTNSKIPKLSPETYALSWQELNGQRSLVILGGSPRGMLYGAFAFLRKLALHENIDDLNKASAPFAPIRILNHWDNLDGTIERGYAGKSIFWDNGHVTADLGRVRDYARLMASLGINGCSINNVNADARPVSPAYLPEVAKLAEAMRPWGVRLFISLDFASPRTIGGIDTFDPLDPRAVEFWQHTVDDVYAAVPDLGGFVLKADSEGRLGPSEYHRTHADAANAIARSLKPHGGLLFYRGFVYDHNMDWRNPKNDRATAAYDNFHRLDGRFEDNVVIQIKNGPIDFQVREPPSPLFSGLEHTSQAIELQITQEYLGQQKHVCYTAPMWKEVLDFDMHAADEPTPVKELIAGRTFHRPTGGFVGVANVGRDANWLGHHLAMANLYAFGRLAWNPNLTSEQIAEEWTRQTFGANPQVVATIVKLLLQSWPAYERYTGPLGIGTLTDIIHIHFGPAPESSEYNGWGQWHRANESGVGMDRTATTGTGFTRQYRPEVARRFESLTTCPEEVLLFFHHVPYTYRLKSGKTLIQTFYDEHYAGAEQAAQFAEDWRSLAGKIDDQRYREVLVRLEFQAGHAQVWRDAFCRWFDKRSRIVDEQGRVDHYPHRLEAEDQPHEGYMSFDAVPWESASGSRGMQLPAGATEGSIEFPFHGAAGWYELRLQYFDENDGSAKFTLALNDQPLDAWIADGGSPTPTAKPDAHASTRRTIGAVALRPGDRIRLTGAADGDERAAVDYLEIIPQTQEQSTSHEGR